MPPVKSLDRISEKWARVVEVSQPDYEAGVQNPREDWAEKTLAAEGNYSAGVQRAISEKRFGKGVRAAGTDKWRARTLSVGPDRWLQGVRVSRGNYEAGFAPYRETIIRTVLPPRGPKGDPKNVQRVAVLAKALHDEKLKRGGV